MLLTARSMQPCPRDLKRCCFYTFLHPFSLKTHLRSLHALWNFILPSSVYRTVFQNASGLFRLLFAEVWMENFGLWIVESFSSDDSSMKVALYLCRCRCSAELCTTTTESAKCFWGAYCCQMGALTFFFKTSTWPPLFRVCIMNWGTSVLKICCFSSSGLPASVI